MKVSEILAQRFAEANAVKERVPKEDFRFTLSKLSDENLSARLTSLVDQIYEQGKRVARHVDFTEMRQYRSLIADFLGQVVSNSHQFNRENFLDRRGRHHVYGIVRLINQELDDLAQDILAHEKNHIQILDRIDQIQGLILDLLV